jgi:hypothetical protein
LRHPGDPADLRLRHRAGGALGARASSLSRLASHALGWYFDLPTDVRRAAGRGPVPPAGGCDLHRRADDRGQYRLSGASPALQRRR